MNTPTLIYRGSKRNTLGSGACRLQVLKHHRGALSGERDWLLLNVYMAFLLPLIRLLTSGATTRSSTIVALRVETTRCIQQPLRTAIPLLRREIRNQLRCASAEFLETSDYHSFVVLTTVTSTGDIRQPQFSGSHHSHGDR